MNRLFKEPLVLFLILGAGIFAAERLWGGSAANQEFRIEITEGLQNQILDQWQAQMGRPPTEQEAAGLLEQWIREEIYYREARTMGLDQNDTIIRRRLAQKLTFLNEDLANAEAPDREALAVWFEAHAADYVEPDRFSFEHRYFSSDRRENAEAAATAALAEIRSAAADDTEDPATRGDPFILQRSYADRSAREIADLFGQQFSAALTTLEANAGLWQGPIESAYGWHLVRVSARTPSRQPALDEVLDAVTRDYQQARRREANDALYQALRSRYDIHFADTEAG